MKRCLGDSPEPWRRVVRRLVRLRISNIEGVEDFDDAEGVGWKTSVVPRVSMISMVSWVSKMLEGIPDETAGRNRGRTWVWLRPRTCAELTTQPDAKTRQVAVSGSGCLSSDLAELPVAARHW